MKCADLTITALQRMWRASLNCSINMRVTFKIEAAFGRD